MAAPAGLLGAGKSLPANVPHGKMAPSMLGASPVMGKGRYILIWWETASTDELGAPTDILGTWEPGPVTDNLDLSTEVPETLDHVNTRCPRDRRYTNELGRVAPEVANCGAPDYKTHESHPKS